MGISKLQDCNSSGSVYQFSVSSESAVEKIVGSDNKGSKTFTFVSQKLLALIILKITPPHPPKPDEDQLHFVNDSKGHRLPTEWLPAEFESTLSWRGI